ncbi:imelysin family protein [Candidatus Poriferisodalis sp.]|uniref:imelysin family protein n=1 Tax=Candidatus Poriferisodalis sp. TaxID=3101277 RepID=UPI003B52FB77
MMKHTNPRREFASPFVAPPVASRSYAQSSFDTGSLAVRDTASPAGSTSQRRRPAFRILAACALVVAGCSSGATPREAAVNAAAAEAFANQLRLNAQAEILVDSIDELCATPKHLDGNVAGAATDAIVAMRHTWSYTAAMQIDSVTERRSWAVIDWPISTDDITSLLLDESKDLTPERIGKRSGADQRGLGAAEHLLALHLADEQPPPPSAGTAQRRCEYLSSVGEVMLEESELILGDAWLIVDGDEPLFKLIAPDAEMGVDRLVNEAIFLLEAMTDMELGRALGETSAETRLDAVVEGPLGLGAADMGAHLDGLRAVLLGTDHAISIATEAGMIFDFDESSGFRLLLDDDLVSRLTDQFHDAQTTLEQVEGPLRDAVVNDSATVSRARAALKALQITISTEVVAQLGVTIGFSDADGDSSA